MFSLFKIIIVALIFATVFSTVYTGSVRTRGAFDRFGANRNLLKNQFKSRDAEQYYHHPDGARIIKESNFEMDYELGRKIVFMCTAVGNPRPVIVWFKDGIELDVHSWYKASPRSITEWMESDTRMKSKMEIDPATTMDRGEYECIANNKFAIDRRRFRTDYIEFDNPMFIN